ncbi:serine/threonine protein kinase [Flavisolibacter ginsenosidimutans]|uniref:Serine/threonine protein kinase n=1 Tax=Flavisolibacter ginsenosidimutans TaxID=661481 RepID=A0A5B8UH09_9BACT|nr:serine/threonine-protein kinase [Flavisolibacter ginsenosidimutans]QEC55927.1 serine/threonine protein kinase [Flavisolibacter ginsenosidimutans]
MSKVFTITEGLENMGAVKTGGQGSVYKGKRTGEIITAVKLLPTPIVSQSEDDPHYRDFANEVKKLQRVNEEPNPHVVKILSYGVSETGCFPFIEMEFVDGPDLCDLLKESSVFSVKQTIQVAEQLAYALAHCHKQGVKHGDVKTNNVKFNQYTGNYVLIDFGLAILSDEERRTSLRYAGAIEFMAPEQNEGHLYFETDVYSYGIVLYELLAGRVPFPLNGNSETARNKVMVAHMEAPPPELLSLRHDNLPQDWDEEKRAAEMNVPAWLLSIVDKCLQKNPEDRFKNGEELYEAIVQHSTQFGTNEGSSLAALAYLDELKTLQKQLKQKEETIEALEANLYKQTQELDVLRSNGRETFPLKPAKRGVSKGAFVSLMVATTILTLLTIYSLFFQHRTAAAVSTTAADSTYVDSSVNVSAAKESRPHLPKASAEKPARKEITPEELLSKEAAIEKEKQKENSVVTGSDNANPAVRKAADTVRKKTLPADEKQDAPVEKKEEVKKEKDTTGSGN